MSLLNLVHRNVIIKFTDAAGKNFKPETAYVFRLTGVDAMGFLHIQDLKPGHHAAPETASEPYWINKDLIREIHEVDLAKVKETLHYTGPSPKLKAENPVEQVHREVEPKTAKTKLPVKPKTALKPKPLLN